MAENRGNGALRVLLQFLRAQEAGDPYAFRFAPQDYILPTVGGDSPSARFDWTPEVLADLQAVRLPGRDPAVVQRIGERLRRFVKDAGWAQHEQQIAQALAEHRPIFVTIRSSAAELYALPWELLTLKSGQFIGEVDRLLLRFEWPESRSAPEQPKPRHEGGRILFAWSAAAGAVPAAEHTSAIAAACAAGFHPFHADADVLAQASLERIVHNLQEAQRTGPAIAVLHLLCHGGAAGSTFGLCLDGADGPVVVDAAQLRQQLAPFASMVRLVVLSACDSGNAGALGNQLGSVAQALHRCGFQSVIASRFPLSVAGATTLTERFYGELLPGPTSLETALLTARARLARSETNLPREQRHLDWASVQLYARHDDGDDTRPVVFRPFRGLLAFQPEHRRFFFGRDKEVLETLSDLQALSDRNRERFLVVAGASGTGKSSLVLAGAVPKLLERHPQLRFLRMRPGSDPERALNEALSAYPAGTSALLVVDQFEEVFTQTEAPAARDAFVQRLWSLASAPEPGLRVIITLRVDFIGRCGELVVNAAGLRLDRVAYDEEYRVFVAQLEPQQLRAAIVEPARKVGLELEAGLADRMLQEVGNEPGALPLLEDALDVLWQRRDTRVLTQRTYDEVGGVIGALQRRADAIVAKLAKEDLGIAQRLLVNLVAVADDTALDTRLRVALADLQHSFSAAPAAGFERVLKEMVAARLLVQDGDEQTSGVEVAHEALIRKWPRLRAWLDEDRAGLLTQRRVKQAAQQWALQSQDESLLYRGTQLAQAREWRTTWESRLGDLERRFLDASDALRVRQEQEEAERQHRERQAEERIVEEKRQKEQQKLEAAQRLAAEQARRARVLRVAAAVLGVAFVVAVGTGVVAYRESQEARKASLIAGVRELVTRGDSTMASRLLLEVAAPEDTPGWLGLAYDVLNAGMPTAVLRVHAKGAWLAKFSSDGQRIVTASMDGTARVWNAADGKQLALLTGHDQGVRSAVFSPDGQRIVTASMDGTARVWNAADGKQLALLTGRKDKLLSAVFSPDGQRIVTASKDGTARVWRAADGQQLALLHGHDQGVRSAVFSPDGRRIVTVSLDGLARVWNAADGQQLALLHGQDEDVWSAVFSPDGQRVVTASKDGTARVWNAADGKQLALLTGHADQLHSAVFSPDGQRIVTASLDWTARVWNAADGQQLALIKGHEGQVYSAAFNADGRRIVTTAMDGTARIWNADDGKQLTLFRGHQSGVYYADFSADGQRVVIASADGTARVWNASVGKPLALLKGHQGPLWSAEFNADGQRVVTASDDGTARVWSATDGNQLALLKGHEKRVKSAVFSPDGRRIVTTSLDEIALVWNAADGQQLVLLKGHAKGVTSAVFSPDGRRIVTASDDETAWIWNAADGQQLVLLKGHEKGVTSAVFSPDGQRVLTASKDRTARVWNAATGQQLALLTGHEDEVLSAVFSPDGRRVLTASQDKTARIWSVADGQQLALLKGHERMVLSATFSMDGRRVLTTALDYAPRVWSAIDGKPLVVLYGHAGTVQSAAFSPDGQRIVTGSVDRTVRVWNASNGKQLALFKGHDQRVMTATFSADGQRVLSASIDGTARVWTLSVPAVRKILEDATTECLPPEMRETYLSESESEARARYQSCELSYGGAPLPPTVNKPAPPPDGGKPEAATAVDAGVPSPTPAVPTIVPKPAAVAVHGDSLKPPAPAPSKAEPRGDFAVEIDGLAVSGVGSVRWLPPEPGNPKSSGGAGREPPQAPLEIARDFDGNPDLFAWWKSTLDGSPQRRSVAIAFPSVAANSVLRINLSGCYPVAWTGPDRNTRASGPPSESVRVFCEPPARK